MFESSFTPVFPGISSRQLAHGMIKRFEAQFTAAQVKACNTTPLVLVPNSNASMVAIFLGAVLEVYDLVEAWDQNQNFIVKYQTSGGGATVSTTVANFLNGAAEGALKTCKAIDTDITPEPGEDLVLTSSASPYATAGNTKLYVQGWYALIPTRKA